MIPREFDFDGTQRKLDVQKVSDLLYKSRFAGWNYSISQGNNLPAFIPDRYMPIKHIVKADPIATYEKKNPVVIPKGKIVSVNSMLHYKTYSGGSTTEQGITPSGLVKLGTDVFGNPIMANVNDEAYGYGTTINGGFVTIANGGAKTLDKYTQLDVDKGVYKIDGTLAVVDETYEREKNIPIGIAVNNMFIDDKNGGKLNFTTQILELNSIETDYYVTFPFVNTSALSKFTLSVDGAGAQTQGDSYAAVVNDFVYFYGSDIANMIAGKLVTADNNGNYVLMDDDTSVDDAPTCQTVGKLVLLDNRFPKEKMDEILTYGQVTGDPTYEGIGVTGSDTNGIPVPLYLMAWKVLNAENQYAPSTGDIMTAIEAGTFGYVKINLHVS